MGAYEKKQCVPESHAVQSWGADGRRRGERRDRIDWRCGGIEKFPDEARNSNQGRALPNLNRYRRYHRSCNDESSHCRLNSHVQSPFHEQNGDWSGNRSLESWTFPASQMTSGTVSLNFVSLSSLIEVSLTRSRPSKTGGNISEIMQSQRETRTTAKLLKDARYQESWSPWNNVVSFRSNCSGHVSLTKDRAKRKKFRVFSVSGMTTHISGRCASRLSLNLA